MEENRRLLNFVSQEQLEELKKTRGERVEDGTAQRERPLHEILNENKAKKQAELSERSKHRPPKSLDEDEIKFLDDLERSKREIERRQADEDAIELRRFRVAVAAKSTVNYDTGSVAVVSQKRKLTGSWKNPTARPLSSIFKVKPPAKKAKIDAGSDATDIYAVKSPEPLPKTPNADNATDKFRTGLVTYGDSEDED